MAKSNPRHDTGGKVKLPLKPGVSRTAKFGGKNEEYRYRLTRTWDSAKPFALFVLMNPSTADSNADDRTIAKCCRFACDWGYGGIFVANTFAYRHTYQKRLIEEVSYLIGPDNDRHIIEMAKQAAIVVFAYGKPQRKALRARGKELARLLMEKAHVNPHILDLCKDGTPKHPLYIKKDSKPVPWNL